MLFSPSKQFHVLCLCLLRPLSDVISSAYCHVALKAISFPYRVRCILSGVISLDYAYFAPLSDFTPLAYVPSPSKGFISLAYVDFAL